MQKGGRMEGKDINVAKIEALETKIAEQNSIIARQSAMIEEFKKKEQSISSAIIASMEHANQLEASRKKLYMLDIQRSRLMYLRMEQIINELYIRYPEISKDTKLKDMSAKFKSMVYDGLNDKNNQMAPQGLKLQPVINDPIKKLLHNIIDCIDSKKIAETEKPTVAKQAEPNFVSSSGFDINEALHPTMELEEIMKAFNLGGKSERK